VVKLRVKCRQTRLFAPSYLHTNTVQAPYLLRQLVPPISHLRSQTGNCAPHSERQRLQLYILQFYSRPLPEMQLRVLLLK
jgi:hypothetical protein